MSVSSKMTAIADKIRMLLGLTDAMGLDAMATNLGTEQTNIANAFTAVSDMGGAVPDSQVTGNLADAIRTISTGIKVQNATGSFSLSGGAATVNCGFQPDAVYINLGDDGDGNDSDFAAIFSESANTKYVAAYVGSGSYNNLYAFITRSATGFTISDFEKFTDDWDSTTATGSYSYTAVKYTE